MPKQGPVDEFVEEALFGRKGAQCPTALRDKLRDVLDDAVLKHNDFGYRFTEKARDDPYGALEWAAKEGELGRWLIRALASTPHLSMDQKRRFLKRLLPWAADRDPRRRFESPVPYYTGVDFLVRQGEPLQDWFPYLVLPSHPDDVELAPGLVQRSVEGPSVPPDWTAFLMVRLPLIFGRAPGQKRLKALRDCADAFFGSSLSAEAKERVKRAMSRGRRGGVSFRVPLELAHRIPAFVQMEGKLKRWRPEDGPELWEAVRIQDERLYPHADDWLPYWQALDRKTARARGPKGLARALLHVSDARHLHALVEPILAEGAPLPPEVEHALRLLSRAHDPAVRASSTDVLLAFGSDPVGDAERAQRDVAEQVRRSPARVAISQVKMATLPAARRRVLLSYVREHREAYELSPKQATAFARWVQMVGVEIHVEPKPASEARPPNLDPWVEEGAAAPPS